MTRKLFLTLFGISSLLLPFAAFSSNAAAISHSRKVCAPLVASGLARCHAIELAEPSGVTPLVSNLPTGYGPADFSAAYNNHGGHSMRVAVVGAYDAPTILKDANQFSKAFGLPGLTACASSNQPACLQKLDEHGGTNYPIANADWSVETSLDVESIHGQCPGCHISLVEATTPTMANLTSAVDTAATNGAQIVSNSYGGPESAAELSYDKHYKHNGVLMVASSGDSGYGTSYPAASPNVIAVGGTSLKMKAGRVINEAAWSGAGSGCSRYELKPVWQHDAGCSRRSVADVAADADPQTGAAIYDSYATGTRGGWLTVGGTSLAAPLVAGMIASSGDSNLLPATLYSNQSSLLRDITSGQNGSCTNYLCHAGRGYDGPTGLGVLNNL